MGVAEGVGLVLIILALIWAAVLLPPLFRRLLEGSPADSVGRFRRHMRVLESTGPAASSLAADPVMAGLGGGMPMAWAQEARRLRRLRRRRQVAVVLLAIMASTLVLGLIPSLRFMLVLHVGADVCLLGYVALLVKARDETNYAYWPEDTGDIESAEVAEAAEVPVVEVEANAADPHAVLAGQAL